MVFRPGLTISYRSTTEILSDLDYDLSKSLKVKSNVVNISPIYDFLSWFNIHIGSNLAPLGYIGIQNLSDIDFGL